MSSSEAPAYLQPYLDAARKYGAGFGTLLWASPRTQAARFTALLRAVDVAGKVVLDVGCGRADLMEHLLSRRQFLKQYIGLEAVEDLAAAAEAKGLPNSRIMRADFVRDSRAMDVGADIIFFSGSLNTLDKQAFYRSISAAFTAAREAVVFNFLSSPFLAASSYLVWHGPVDVMEFAHRLSLDVQCWDDYLKGDSTVIIRKEPGAS